VSLIVYRSYKHVEIISVDSVLERIIQPIQLKCVTTNQMLGAIPVV